MVPYPLTSDHPRLSHLHVVFLWRPQPPHLHLLGLVVSLNELDPRKNKKKKKSRTDQKSAALFQRILPGFFWCRDCCLKIIQFRDPFEKNDGVHIATMQNSKFLRSNNLRFFSRFPGKFYHASRTSILWATSLLHHFHILPLLARFGFVFLKRPKESQKDFCPTNGCEWKFRGLFSIRFLPQTKKSWLKREFIETSKPQARRKRYSVKLFRWHVFFEKTSPQTQTFPAVHKNHRKSTSKIVTIPVVLPRKGSSPAITLPCSPGKKHLWPFDLVLLVPSNDSIAVSNVDRAPWRTQIWHFPAFRRTPLFFIENISVAPTFN